MKYPPPAVATVSRGGRVESRHRADGALVDETGRLLGEFGDPALPVYLRSAAKPFQALPLLEAGGAQHFRLAPAEIALICASHGGQPRHVRVAQRLLERGGFGVRDLVCGAHAPAHAPSARALARRDERPSRLHNNCSGKHAGLLLACRILGFPPRGYWRPEHPLQLAIRRRLSELSSTPEGDMEVAIDGCGLAVLRLPLSAVALAYARLMARRLPGESRAQERARRLVRGAMWERPEMVAGTGFFTTAFLRAGRGRWIGKEGAEGVYAVGVRPKGPSRRAVGVALKIEDGSERSRAPIVLAVMRRSRWLSGSSRRALAAFESPLVRNAAGDGVGAIHAEVPIIRPDATG